MGNDAVRAFFVADFLRIIVFWIFKKQFVFDFFVEYKTNGFVVVLSFNSCTVTEFFSVLLQDDIFVVNSVFIFDKKRLGFKCAVVYFLPIFRKSSGTGFVLPISNKPIGFFNQVFFD